MFVSTSGHMQITDGFEGGGEGAHWKVNARFLCSLTAATLLTECKAFFASSKFSYFKSNLSHSVADSNGPWIFGSSENIPEYFV